MKSNRKVALITGITGQDGSYLAEFLLKKGYDVQGIIREESIQNRDKLINLENIINNITIHKGDVSNFENITTIFKKVMPTECYHLSGTSFVNYSFEKEFMIMNDNFNSTYYLLSAINKLNKNCKFFFAGSSEMFGEPYETPQTENSKFNPKSLYGISKLSSYYLVKNYREKEKKFACTGIMYNHESPRRGNEFVTKKIISSAVKIKLGLENKLYLGNLDAKRDWGYAPDYVKAMWKILQADKADDFIISTGNLHTVREFLDITFSYLDLEYQDYVEVDPKFFRASEKKSLCGTPNKIKEIIGWKNTKGLKEIIKEMIDSEINIYSLEGKL